MEFPKSKKDEQSLIKKIEQSFKATIQSPTDLAFLKAVILELHAEEITYLHLDELNLSSLPWETVCLKIINIKRGSTILIFSLGLKNLVETQEELDTYRVMELVILTFLENIQFIKNLSSPVFDRHNLEINAKIELEKYDETKYKEVIRQIIFSLRSFLQSLVSANTPEKDKERGLLEILQKKERELWDLRLFLTEDSMGKIVKIVKDSRLAENDISKLSIHVKNWKDEFKRRITRRRKATSVQTSYLFPYNFRRLDDIDDDKFKQIIIASHDLPGANSDVYKKFVYYLDFDIDNEIAFCNNLIKKVMSDLPYPEILDEYRLNGGTFGGLISALEKLETNVVGSNEIKRIVVFSATVESIRHEICNYMAETYFNPDPHPSILNAEDFQKVANLKLKVKTNVMKPFEELRHSFQPGDQVWIFRNSKFYVRSYAHVIIILDENQFMHVTDRNILTLQSEIKRANLSVYSDVRFCFIVRSEIDKNILERRATLCEGIRFHYHPKHANCEVFCNGVHGIWDPSIQVDT